MFTKLVHRIAGVFASMRDASGEEGMTTAELLGNAALGVAALIAIWAVMQSVGINVANWIQGRLIG